VKKHKHNRVLCGIIVFVSLLFLQVLLGKTGHFFADMIPYRQIDPYDIFAGISIHHTIQMILALVFIVLLSKLLKINFHFQLGDVRKGIKYLVVFTAAFAVISIILHILMYVNNQLPNYAFPLDRRNIIGTLGFQIFLSGPSEEVVFRALPITILIYAFGKSIPIKGNITLEVILASMLFSFAHANWSLRPFVFDVDYFQILYAFVLGTIQGVVYQRSKSILYPMLMHSFSNVLMVGIGYLFLAKTL
jgi:membrane protease YdiL (CAAX protease family)